MRRGRHVQIGRRARIRLFVLVALATAIVVTPEWAQSPGGADSLRSEHDANWANCLSSDSDIVIKGCTAIIDAHGDPPAELAAAFNNRGKAYAGRHEYERAIQDFNAAIRIKPGHGSGSKDPTPLNYASALSDRGIAYIHAGDFNLAILDFNEEIHIMPDDADAFYYRGMAYSNSGDYDDAINDFNKSLQMNPGNANALYARGVTKRKMNDAPGAESDKTAARQIDPDVAAKVVSLSAPVAAVAPPVEPTPSQSSSVPSCGGLPDDSPGSVKQTSSKHGAPVSIYVDQSVEELKRAVPNLHGIRFELETDAKESMAAEPTPIHTASILDQVGAVTANMLHRMPNLIAREEVEQVTGSTVDLSSGVQNSRRMRSPVQGMPATQYRTHVFGYRIVPGKDSSMDGVIDEYRTDAHDRPIRNTANDPDAPRSTGFATSWLFFVPSNLKESRFRYLGQQKVSNHETYVVAFAQIPGKTHMDTIVRSPNGQCSTFSQGLAWIDQSTFQIVRMQTDLLSPLPDIQLTELRSVLNYGDVKIPKLNLSLWLPSEVETTWLSGDRTGDETHRYSNYKLFAATVTILPADQSPSS